MTPPEQRPVTDALLVALRETDEKVGDGIAPDNPPQRYGVLEALSVYTEGGVGGPEHCIWIEYRFWAIAEDKSTVSGRTSGPRMEAEHLAHLGRSVLLDRTAPITGDGWRVSGRQWISSDSSRDGRTVSVADDYRLFITPT